MRFRGTASKRVSSGLSLGHSPGGPSSPKTVGFPGPFALRCSDSFLNRASVSLCSHAGFTSPDLVAAALREASALGQHLASPLCWELPSGLGVQSCGLEPGWSLRTPGLLQSPQGACVYCSSQVCFHPTVALVQSWGCEASPRARSHSALGLSEPLASSSPSWVFEWLLPRSSVLATGPHPCSPGKAAFREPLELPGPGVAGGGQQRGGLAHRQWHAHAKSQAGGAAGEAGPRTLRHSLAEAAAALPRGRSTEGQAQRGR